MTKVTLHRVAIGLMAASLALATAACGSSGTASSSGGGGTSSPPAPSSSKGAASSSAGSSQVASGGSSSSSKKLIPITIAYTASGSAYGPLYVAQDLGLFKKYGLDAKVIYAKSSSQAVPVLVSKSADIVEGSGDSALRAAAKGVTNVRIFGSVIPDGFLEWWAQPNIKTPKDLIGKTIGSTSPGSLGDLQTRVWLTQNGIKPSQVKIAYVGSLSGLIAAMKSNRTAATLILPPLGEQLKAAGDHKLGDLRSLKYASIMDMALSSYLKNNPQAVEDFLKAQAEAVSILETKQSTVLPILAKWTKTTKASWNLYAYNFYKPLWVQDPKVDMSVLTATVNVLKPVDPGLAKLTLSDYVDNSFAAKLESQGFFKALPK